MKHQTFSFRYRLYQGTYQTEGVSHIGYGIEIIHAASGKPHKLVENIDTTPEMILSLVERCNRLELDPEHIYDVIEDAFAYDI